MSVPRSSRLLLDLNDYESQTGFAWEETTRRPPLPRGYEKVPIPQSLRIRVFARDDFKCRHCGSAERLQCDHIIPESKGGSLDMDNLQTLCKSCNSRKGARV